MPDKRTIHHLCTTLDIPGHGFLAIHPFVRRMIAAASPGPPVPAAVGEIPFFWVAGQTIRIAFVDAFPSPDFKQRVKDISAEWLDFANLKFDFVNANDGPDVTITFAPAGAGIYNSLIGTQSRTQKPSMTLAFQPELTEKGFRNLILHEFGHVLGLHHEHQNPVNNPLHFDRAAVLEWFRVNQPNWTRQMVEDNIFTRLELDSHRFEFTPFDAKSIMIYEILSTWTTDGFHVERPPDLSATDQQFIKKIYPGKDKPDGGKPVKLQIGGDTLSGSLRGSGDVNIYVVEVAEADIYQFETTGDTDVVIELYGPNDGGLFIKKDDESGEGRNARLFKFLEPAAYFLKVHASDFLRGIEGDYEIFAKRAHL